MRADSEEQALAQLARGEDPEKVVARLARQLTNKLMHAPTLGLREASGAERQDLIEAAEALLFDSASDPEASPMTGTRQQDPS